MADIVTPLLQTFKLQGDIEQQKATAMDTRALAQQRMGQVMLNNLLLQQKIETQNAMKDAYSSLGNDPRMMALAPSPDDSPEVASDKNARRMQVYSSQAMQVAQAVRARGGDPAIARQIEKDAIDAGHWAAYDQRQALQERQDMNNRIGSLAGTVSDEDSFQQAYEGLKNIMPPQRFAQLRFNQDPQTGQPTFGPLSQSTMRGLYMGGQTANQQGLLAIKALTAEERKARDAQLALDAEEKRKKTASEIERIDAEAALARTRAREIENPTPKPAKAATPTKITPATAPERAAANDAIDAEDFSGVGEKWDPAGRRAFASDVADRAKKIFVAAQNAGESISLDDARQQAIDDLKPYVKGKKVDPGFFSSNYTAITYERGKNTPPVAKSAGGTPQVKSQAEYDALPAGAEYIWNGQKLKKAK